MTPQDFYIIFTPLKEQIKVPIYLKQYADGLSSYYDNKIKIEYYDEGIDTKIEENLDPKKAVMLFSGGIDSTWSLLKHLELEYEVYPVFINELNPAISKKELIAVKNLCLKYNLKLTLIDHLSALKRLHSGQFLNEKLGFESVVKNQYALLLLEDFIRQNKIGTIIYIVDHEDDDEDIYYSDSSQAYENFQSYLRLKIGNLNFSNVTVKRLEKVKKILELNLFEDIASCYMPVRFFKAHYNRMKPPFKNMCGVCFKCKSNLKIFKELNFI